MKKLIIAICSFALIFGLTACGGNSGSAELSKTMESMKAVITNTEMMELTDVDLMPNYGIDKAMVKQFAMLIDSTGIKGDELILLEGSDAQSAKTLKEKLDARYKQKENEMKDYLPEEYAMLTQCTVQTRGNYVALIVSPQYEELLKIYNDSFK